jgi:hypothetical protein
VPGHSRLWLVQGAIRLSAPVLATDKQQLASQLWGRRLAEESSDIQAFMTQTQAWYDADWLRTVVASLTSSDGPLILTLVGPRRMVNSVAVTADGWLALHGSHSTISASAPLALQIAGSRSLPEALAHDAIATKWQLPGQR